MFLGLRSHILATEDITATRDWYSEVLGLIPSFDEPFYVGFNVGGYELGLVPRQNPDYPTGGETYWGVADVAAAVAHFTAKGASLEQEVHDVGGGILMAVLLDPAGNRIGLIYNPHFTLE